MNKIGIRQAVTERDLALIQKIEKLNGNFWPNRYIRKDFLENDLSIYLILKEGDKPVGYTCFMKIIDEIHINNIQVLEAYRSRGLGQALVQAILAYYKGQAIGASLEVAQDNDPAIRLYTKMGFEIVGARPGYYKNKKTAILMYKQLEEEC